jgi:hypothetical protein
MEIARPGGYGTMPGNICPRCQAWPAFSLPPDPRVEYEAYNEVDEPDLDDLADLVARRLIEHADARREAATKKG